MTNPNDSKATWRYYLARSDDYGKSWDRATVTPQPFHYGDICTAGINCSTGGNRNLADFYGVDADVQFVNVAREAGLRAKTIYGSEKRNRYLIETTGCGAAFFDYD